MFKIFFTRRWFTISNCRKSKISSLNSNFQDNEDIDNNKEILEIINNQESHIAQIEQRIPNWTIPKVEKKTIYEIGKFIFSSRLCYQNLRTNFTHKKSNY